MLIAEKSFSFIYIDVFLRHLVHQLLPEEALTPLQSWAVLQEDPCYRVDLRGLRQTFACDEQNVARAEVDGERQGLLEEGHLALVSQEVSRMKKDKTENLFI